MAIPYYPSILDKTCAMTLVEGRVKHSVPRDVVLIIVPPKTIDNSN